MPAQEVCDAPGRTVDDAGEDVGEVEFRIEAVQLGALSISEHITAPRRPPASEPATR
jgi:hypothetical protein